MERELLDAELEDLATSLDDFIRSTSDAEREGAAARHHTHFTKRQEALARVPQAVEQLLGTCASLKTEISALERALATDADDDLGEPGGTTAAEVDTRVAFLGALHAYAVPLRGVLSSTSPNAADISAAIDEAPMRQLASLREGVTDDAETVALWESMKQLAPRARVVAEAFEQQAQRRREQLAATELERQRMLLWCRQQRTNLDAVVDEDVNEFCVTIVENCKAMEDNLTIIAEKLEPHLPDDTLQQQLIELNEVWLHLLVASLERLRHDIIEVHPRSKLEDEVRTFSPHIEGLQDFYNTFHELLSMPSDAESQEVVRPTLERCGELRKANEAFAALPGEMEQFARRVESQRENFATLRRAVLSRVTFLTSSVPVVAASQRRREEYAQRVEELRGWMERKSQGESWRSIHDRLRSIRKLLESEQAALQAQSS